MTPEDIIGEVALVTGIPAPAIMSRRRTMSVCQARFIAIAAIRQEFPWWSLESTAAFFRRREHCTIINARKRHRDLLQTDSNYKALATQVCQNLFACPTR
jgi:chromosomal replication initiation ATPase DnaA